MGPFTEASINEREASLHITAGYRGPVMKKMETSIMCYIGII